MSSARDIATHTAIILGAYVLFTVVLIGEMLVAVLYNAAKHDMSVTERLSDFLGDIIAAGAEIFVYPIAAVHFGAWEWLIIPSVIVLVGLYIIYSDGGVDE